MGQTDYIIRFKGDYSALEKDLNKIGQATRKLEEDEVLIKLNYDGNIKEFNKVFDKISNMHPELGIQFQYNINQKMLEQELNKIDQLTEIKLDVDENKVQTKLKNLADNVDTALQGSMSKDEITKRLKNVFAYYNTAVKAGAKNINFDSITNRLYDSFSVEADEIKNIFDDVFDLNDNKKFELFKLDKSVFDELSEAKSRAEDIRNILKSLEEKGASKTGLPSELQKVQDEIKILRSDIEEMKGDLKNLSGDAFDELTQQIKDTNEQLDYALQAVNQLKSALSSNGIKEDKSISGVIKQWKNENETKTNERYTAFNSQTKQTSGAHLAANAEGVGMKLIRTAIDEMGNDADGVIHSHPMKFAAFSDDDIERYFSLFEDSQGKIFSQVVTSTKQAMSLDMSKINTSKKSEILQQIKDEYSKIDDSLIGNFSGKTEELKSVVYNILNSSESEYPELISKIRSNIDSMFESIGESFSWMDFSNGFDDLLISSAKDVAKTYSNPKEMISKLLPDLGSIMENVENAVLNPLTDLAQQSYQEVLQRVFTNPEFLKSGETSAIKLEALSDFIDWGSIEDSAREAAQKAADALQEAQDSNSSAELTKPLGKDFGLGYAEGIREAMPEIVTACREIVLAAYNAIKEAKTSEDGESVDFSEGFINSFKESLDKAVPTIQEKIKEVFSKINIGDENSSMFEGIGQEIIDSIIVGLKNAHSGESFTASLESIINNAFTQVALDSAVREFLVQLQTTMDTQGSLRLKYFSVDTDNIAFQIQNGLDNKTFDIDLSGTINNLATTLNTSADNVRSTFIDAIKWMQQANEWQKGNIDNTHERTLFFNSKTGQFSNPTVTGNENSVSYILSRQVLDYYNKQGVTFDTDLHSHQDFDYAAPSDISGDLSYFFKHVFEDNIDKFIVMAQKELAVFDFSKIASSKNELEKVLGDWVSDNITQIENEIGKKSESDNIYEIDESNTEYVTRYISNIYTKIWNAIYSKLQADYKYISPENMQSQMDSMFAPFGYGDNKLRDIVTGEIDSASNIFGDLKNGLASSKFDYNLDFDTDEYFDNLIAVILDDFHTTMEDDAVFGVKHSGSSIKDSISNIISKIFDSEEILKNISRLDDNSLKNDFIEKISHYMVDDQLSWYAGEITDSKISNSIYQEAGSMAMKQLISQNDLVGKLVSYYNYDEFEKKFGTNIKNISQIPTKQYTMDDYNDWARSLVELDEFEETQSLTMNGESFYDDEIIKWKDKLLSYFPELLERQAQELFDYMNSSYGNVGNFDEEFLSKINSYVAQNTRQQQNDSQSQLQSGINESGEYLAKVYGDLVEDFKSRLQNAIDETGLYHVDIEGWLYDTFHDGLQQDIDGQEKYIIEVKGRLFDTFKEVLQEAIDGLGAFPIEVKPYINKDEPIEEIETVNEKNTFQNKLEKIYQRIDELDLTDVQKNIAKDLLNGGMSDFSKSSGNLEELINLYKELNILDEATEGKHDTTRIFTTPLDLESVGDINSTTQAYLSKKEVVEQLRTELNLTKKAAEDLFDAQGYEKTNNRYQIEQTAVEELIASIKEKQEIEGTSENPNNSPVLTSIDAETQKFDELKKKIATEIPNAIQKKNDAFRKEEEVVAEVVGNEIDYFDVLKDSIGDVETAVQHQYDTSMNATAKDEESKTSTSISSQKNLKSELSSLDKIENKIKELGLSANATQEALSLLYGGKATFLWIGQNQEEQWDKINDLIQLYKELGIVKREVDDSDAFTTTIETTSLKDIQKQKYQSVGQKSDILKEMAAYYSQLEEESAAMAEAAFSNAEKKVNSLLSKISKLQSSGKYTQAFTSELDAAEQELRSFSDDLKNGDIPFDELESRITSLADNVENTLAKKAFGEVKLAAEKSLTSVGLKIDQIVAKNSAMGDEFESRFQKLRDSLDTAESIDDVQKLVAEVNKLESELIAAGKTGRSFFDQIKQRLRDINSKYIAQYFSFQDIIRYARTAISTIQDLNTQMVELAKVSEQSLSEIQDDFNSYADTAKDLGSTITDTISATADWARMGYNVPDSQELARVALLYKNVGDGIDVSAANESLISTLQGYQMTADEAEHIVDVFNEVANNFAIDTGGIGEALQRSAASLNAANTSLEQSVALVTAANTVVQNPESVGTTFKTLSARIRGATTELEDLGEEEDEFTQTTSKLQGLVKSLTGFDILEDDQKTFKSIYDIIIGIGKEWKNLDDIERASLGEALAGKRNANTLYAILDNIETLESAYATAEDSAGSAMREQQNFEQGLEYSINRAKAALEELANDAIDSELVKSIVDAGTTGIEFLDNIIDKVGVFKTLIVGASGIVGAKQLDLFSYGKNGLTVGGSKLNTLFTNENENILSQGNNQAFLNKFKDESVWGSKATTSEWIAQQADNMGDVNESLVAYVQNAKDAGTAAANLESVWISQTSAATKFQGVLSKLGDVGGKAIATLGNALVSMGISMAASLVIQAVQDVINSYDELVAKTSEITTAYTQAQSTLEDYTSQLVNIRTKLEDESTTTEEAAQMTQQLYTIQNDLIDTYGAYAAGLDLVNGKLEDQVGILQEINKYNLQQWENEVNAERSNASKALNYSKNITEAFLSPIAGITQGGQAIWDWIGGKSFKDSLNESIFGEDIFGKDTGTDILGNNIEQIAKKYEKFSDVINATDNKKINDIIDSFEEFEVVGGKIKVAGNVEDVSDAVKRLQIQLSDLGYQDKELNTDLVNIAKDTQDIIDSSGESYNTFLYSQIMHSDELVQKYISLTEAYNNYKSAQESGDSEAADKALESYLNILGDIENSGIEEKYIKYFETMHEDLQNEVSNWKIEFDIAPKINGGLEDYIAGNSYEEIFSDYLKWGQEDIDLPDSIENYFELLTEYADEAGISVMQLISLLQQLDSFDYSKAEATLKKASNGGGELSTELYEATKAYYDAVAQYNKVGANRDSFNSGNVELGQGYDLDTSVYSTDDFEIVYTPYVYNPDTGEKEQLTSQEINDYINEIIKTATDQETGEIDFDMVMKLDQEGIYNDSTGHVMQNLFMHAGNQGYDFTKGYQEEAKAINDRIVAFRDLYNAANDANMTVEEVKDAYTKGLNWTDEQIANFLGSLDEDDLKTLLTLDLDDISKVETEEELRQMIKDAQTVADENPVELSVKTSDLTSDLDEFGDAFGNIETVYETTVTNGGTVDASDLQGVNEDMGGVTFNEQNFADVNAMSSAIEKYNQTLAENPNNSAKAQEAVDDLATSYVDLSGVMDNVTESNKELAIEKLELEGIENAEEVVISRLNSLYKNFSKNLQTFAKKVAQYHDTLEEGVSAENWDTAANDIASSIQKLFTTVDEDGNEIVPNIDTSFVEQNLDKIKLAAEDDTEAIALLRVEAAKTIDLEVNVNDDEIYDAWTQISNMVAGLDGTQFEIGGYMDDSAIIAALNNILSTGAYTVAEFKKMVSQISGGTLSAEVSWETKDVELAIPVIDTAAYNSQSADHSAGSYTKYMKTKVSYSLPKFEYKYNGSSTGASVKNYNGGGSSSSSGGGGGDSGGSDDTSTDEDTFDWIEVKIDRLEEQLARLDEAIDDVYDNWGNRNDAISEKIKTVTDEIETQKDASKRYLEEANKYADLIGKEYVEKVQNGEIDIETIKVETSGDDDSNTLIENIQEYQTWYEKYIEASDQVNTLSRELNSYYKDLFDNVESEYEDLLDEIEKKTSIIEERITRTEEHGFFVDEAYYTALKSLEEENFNKLEKEREELITKLNNAVTTGKIKKGSEAWYEMYLAIQDVNKAIEESMTNTVKLNNEIRQLKWDKFDWVEERMDDFAEEADFLIKLLQGEETIDDRGYFNNRGFANAALIGAKYDDALAEAQRYADAIKEIDKNLATEEGKYDKNLIDRKEELVSAYRSAIEAAEDEKQAMKSLVEEAVKQHLDYLSKLIDKYKDALSTMKSTYEYAKNINDQTKNISNLEKQLAAYQGDTSEEARKKRQELQNQLDSAQQQLEETQWDKYISETGEMLDNLYNNYETYLNDKLSNVAELMTSMIDMINQGTYTVPGAVTLGMNSIIAQLSGEGSITTAVKDTTISIKDGMDEIRDEYDLITQKFNDFGDTVNGTKDILSAWSNGKYTSESTFVSKLDEVKNEFSKITNGAADTIKNAILSKSKDITVNDNGTVSATDTYKKNNGNGGGSSNGSGDDDKRPDGIDNSMHITDVLEWGERGWTQTAEGLWRYRKDDGSYIGENTETGEWYQDEDGWWYHFDPSGVMSSNEYVEGYWLDGSGHMMPDLFKWYGDESTGWWFGTEDGSKYEKGRSVYIDGKWYDFDENGWMKYASGSRSIPTNRLAWTQDEGQELIYRTTDGALLTPLNQGDMVFTNEMSQRLWEIASGQIPIGGNIEVPIIGGGTTAGNVTANNNITIELPNVENYDDFKKAMKQDTELEKFWQEITIGQMMGNARLKKNKY